MAGEGKYRVIQWATGNVGTRAMRAVVEHPDMELAGLWVSNPDKAGLDAARLVERDVGYEGSCPETGVIASQSAADMVATPADCVLYMRQGKCTEAEELDIKELAAKRRQLGGDHPDTLNSMNNLG